MCEHERLRTVGNRVFCCACGKELHLEFLLAKSEPKQAEPKQGEKPKRKPRKKEGASA